MSNIPIIENVLRYIDEHLKYELSLNKISKVANFSPYHFSRIFQWHTGYPLMTYVRIRRLEFIVSEMNDNRNFLDLAVKYGFESYSGFTKAFKRHYGMSPDYYRRNENPIKPVKPDLMHINTVGGLIMNPKFINHEEIILFGYELKTSSLNGLSFMEIPEFWQTCIADGKLEMLHESEYGLNDSEYGACSSIDVETGEFTYLIGRLLKAGVEELDGFTKWKLPSATYAVFTTPPSKNLELSTILKGTWQFIMNEWFPKSGYEFAPNCFDFELYNYSENGDICHVYVPVVKKEV